MRIWLLAAAMVLAVAGRAGAETLEAKQISADARWVVHFDLDALWASRAAEQMLKPLLDSERAQGERKKFRAAMGFDMIDGVHGLTVWSDRYELRRGVVLLYADVEEAPIAGFLAGQPDYKTSQYAGHELHAWTNRGHGHSGTLIACVYRESGSATASAAEANVPVRNRRSLLVMSHRRDDIEKALDVLDGKTACLARSDLPPADESRKGTSGQGAIVTIRARGLAEAELPLKSPVVRQCEMLSLAVGEDGSEAYVAGRLVAKSEQSAADIERVLQGLLAMGRLAGDSDTDLQKALNTVELSVEEKTVRLRWHGQVADVVRAARGQWRKKQQRQ